MYDMTTAEIEDKAREILESAISEAPRACACGRPMVINTHGDALWIECESLRAKSGFRLSLASGFHDRRAIELPEGLPAAA
jgi:hypothetical protein